MKAPVFFLALIAWFSPAAPAAIAQAPAPALPVTACELGRNPLQFEGKLVQVRGIVERGFEHFTVRDSGVHFEPSNCGAAIWLEPGGDGQGPRPYAVIHRGWLDSQAHDDWMAQARVDSVKLVKDRQYREMEDRLSAYRWREPDGTLCAGLKLCSLYKVTATITGRFFPAHETIRADSVRYMQGYGHMGCCHLLVIQQVSELVAERTPVPEGGEYSCSTQSWRPTQDEAAQLAEAQPCSDWACKERQYFNKVAAHWSDRVDATNGSGDLIFLNWISSDLTLRYSGVREESGKKKHDATGRPASTLRIDRTECKLFPSTESQQ